MNWFFHVFGSLLGIVALLLTIVEVHRRLCWRATAAHIVRNRIDKKFDENRKKLIRFWVEYRYHIENAGSFTGEDVIELSPTYHEEDEVILNLEAAYAPGTPNEVFYSKRHPKLSTLYKGIGLLKILRPIAVLLLILLTFYLYYNMRMSEAG